MALANNTPYYKMPAEIGRMADDLAVLPAWFAACLSGREGVAGQMDSPFFPSVGMAWQCMETDALLTVKVATMDDVEILRKQSQGGLALPNVDWTDKWSKGIYHPWGWNKALVHCLRESGIAAESLPTEEQLARYRVLAGRQQCVEVLQAFMGKHGICGEAKVCRSFEEVKQGLQQTGQSILKAPWSGSGRGLVRLSFDTLTDSVAGWVARILRTQGYLMLEPLYEKVCDFAMEFLAVGNGDVRFAGYSFFDTDTHGNYKANWLATNEAIEQRLCAWVTADVLQEVRDTLVAVLSGLLGTSYSGYLGVDMMVCRTKDGYRVHPCVEINLRMNMGVVSRLITDTYLAPSVQGWYVVEHYGVDGEALEAHKQLSAAHPVRLTADGRLQSGYFSLTPVKPGTRYQVYLQVEEQS